MVELINQCDSWESVEVQTGRVKLFSLPNDGDSVRKEWRQMNFQNKTKMGSILLDE